MADNVKPTYAKSEVKSGLEPAAYAEKVLGEVQKSDPQNRDALRHYAALLTETNRPEEAAQILKKLQELDPDDPDVPFRRALFLLEARKTDEAEKILKAAGIAHKLIPVPRHISSDCGVCVRITEDKQQDVERELLGKVEWDKALLL